MQTFISYIRRQRPLFALIVFVLSGFPQWIGSFWPYLASNPFIRLVIGFKIPLTGASTPAISVLWITIPTGFLLLLFMWIDRRRNPSRRNAFENNSKKRPASAEPAALLPMAKLHSLTRMANTVDQSIKENVIDATKSPSRDNSKYLLKINAHHIEACHILYKDTDWWPFEELHIMLQRFNLLIDEYNLERTKPALFQLFTGSKEILTLTGRIRTEVAKQQQTYEDVPGVAA